MLTKNIDILRKEVSAHLADYALVKGKGYWESAKNNVGGRGCFIGCLTHSSDPTPAFDRFGLPVAVLRIAENIFDSLPADDGIAFFADLPDAVRCNGKDLSRVHWAFLAAELRALPEVNDDTQAVIDTVISGMDLLAAGKDWPKAAASAAYDASAASAATRVAASAADAARAARDVRAATRVAARAADATDYAADAADAASDAYACRIRQRDTMLHLIETAPVPSGQHPDEVKGE